MDSVPLVEKILSDLMRSSEGFRNLKKQFEEYKNQSLKDKDSISPLKYELEK